MRSPSVLSAAALCLASACSDNIPVEPTTAALSAFSARASATAASSSSDEVIAIDARLAGLAQRVGVALPASTMILGAQVLHSNALTYAQSASLILANDRLRGIGAQYVKGDPRRAGRTGVTYAITPVLGGGAPWMIDPTGTLRQTTRPEVVERIDAGMAAWESLSCSKDLIVRDQDLANADILHLLWFPGQFMLENFGPGVLGVTVPFIFTTDPNNTPDDQDDDIPTDIDGNGLADLAGALIFYNGGGPWSDHGAPNTVDFFSVIAHEAGHALGLNHFGKIFVTKKNIQVDENGDQYVLEEDVKYAPKALMNALYIFGNQETLRGIDNGLFCSIWGGK
jgi:Matrixin